MSLVGVGAGWERSLARGLAVIAGAVALWGCGSVVGVGGETEGDATETGSTSGGDGSTQTTAPSGPSTSPSTTAATSVGPTGPDDTSTSPTEPATVTSATTRSTFSGSEDSGESGVMTIGFIVSPDGGVCSPAGAPDGYLAHCSFCDVWTQDCAAQERCVPWANDGGDLWNSTRCSDVAPTPGLVGDACTVEGGPVSGVDSCALGSLCFNVDPDTLTGTCVANCGGSEQKPICAAGTECVIANDGLIALCLDPCDPLLQDCGSTLGCYGVGEPGQNDPTVCLREETGIYANGGGLPAFCPLGSTGVPSDLITGCSDDAPCCATWCALDDVGACADGFACVPWSDGAGPDPGVLGVCIN